MRTARRVAAGALVLLTSGCGALAPYSATAETDRAAALSAPHAAPHQVPQIARLAPGHGAAPEYELAQVRTGAQPVPRLRAGDVPARLAELESVAARKRLFIKTVLPAALKANEQVADRRRFVQARARLELTRAELPQAMRARLSRLEEAYGVAAGDTQALLARVDRIPVSLLLAQAAIESGWGTSRFAQQGNALFGQRTHDPADPGMVPAGLDDPDFRVRAFGSVEAAVAAYLHNLNTHPAYAGLRRLRAAARAEGRQATGAELAAALQDYSERGRAYIDDLRSIIAANDLADFRDARLAPDVRRLVQLQP